MKQSIKKLDVSQSELELIASALETQSKILRMQASAGGHGAFDKLNEVKRVLATITSHREKPRAQRPKPTGVWSVLRSMGQAI